MIKPCESPDEVTGGGASNPLSGLLGSVTDTVNSVTGGGSSSGIPILGDLPIVGPLLNGLLGGLLGPSGLLGGLLGGGKG